MARVDYYAIEQEIQRLLLEDPDISSTTVTVETEQPLDSQPWVAIYLENRSAPSEQPIAAGTQTRLSLKFSIWCWTWSLENGEQAAKERDGLLGKVEIALMRNRKIGNKVNQSWIQGGDMLTSDYQNDSVTSYISGGEIILTAEVTATI